MAKILNAPKSGGDWPLSNVSLRDLDEKRGPSGWPWPPPADAHLAVPIKHRFVQRLVWWARDSEDAKLHPRQDRLLSAVKDLFDMVFCASLTRLNGRNLAHWSKGRAPRRWHASTLAASVIAIVQFALLPVAVAYENQRNVYLFPASSHLLRQGFVRVINHSDSAGDVRIEAFDDSGELYGDITLTLDARQTAHFNSHDLEDGNTEKGLSGSTGPGRGDWRLVLSSDLSIEVLSYIRTTDGFLTSVHDLVPEDDNGLRVATFNPGSNSRQKSLLRLVNPGAVNAEVTIRGVDDGGDSPGGPARIPIPAGAAHTLSAAELESGGADIEGAIGDGAGKWRLRIESDQPVVAMSLLESPKHLTNLSTVPEARDGGIFDVLLFPAADDSTGRQGFVRVVNRSAIAGNVRISAYDDSNRDYSPVTLAMNAGETVHFNSDDLELGNVSKGLSGGTGTGNGDWRLEITSDLNIEVLAYIRTEDGFLTSMLDLTAADGNRSRAAIFNPGSNVDQVSVLRLVNTGAATAEATIIGVDDRGVSFDSGVMLSVPAGATRNVTAQELESGAKYLEGVLGDGSGKWQLTIESEGTLQVVSLLESPTGHLTNISTSYYPIQDIPPPAQLAVYVPDPNLRRVIGRTLGKSAGAVLTQQEVARITELSGSGEDIENLTGIRFAERVTSLDLSNNNLTDISPLSNLSNLIELFLSRNEITDISALAELTELTRLWLGRNEIKNLSPLSGLLTLTLLDLSFNAVSEVSALSGLTKLRSLFLDVNEIADISALSGMKELRSLSFAFNMVSDVSALSELTKLIYLRLYNNEIADISALSGMTELTNLWIHHNQITDISALSEMAKLKVLWLSDNEIRDISPLAELTLLEELMLDNNKILDIAPLSDLARLVRLNLEGNEIEDISPLSHSINLEILNLANNRIMDASPLVENSGLGEGDAIDLSRNPLNDISANEHLQTLLDRGVALDYSHPANLVTVYNDNVVVMEVAESLAEDTAFTGMPLDHYAKTFFSGFDDQFDFLLLFSNLDEHEDHLGSPYFGVYLGVWNETSGLGRAPYFSSSYGSDKKLRGVIHFPYNKALRSGPALHEILHAWANFSVPTATSVHWGFSSANGQLGGFALESLVDLGGSRYVAGRFGTIANGGNSVPYSPIELYLAGFIPPEEVPDLWVAEDGVWLREGDEYVETDDGDLVFVAESPKTYTVDDIVAVHGVREPSSAEAQWNFRAAVVLLTDEEHPATDNQLQQLSEHAAWFSYPGTDDDYLFNFYEATGARGSIAMDGLSEFRKEVASAPANLPHSFGRPPPPFYSTSDGRCLSFDRPAVQPVATSKDGSVRVVRSESPP